VIAPARQIARQLAGSAAAISLALAFLAGPAGAEAAGGTEGSEVPDKPGFRFTKDWFSDNIPQWDRFLEPFRGRSNLNYLEVGVFEGRATVWMVENILSDPSSRITALDVFPQDLQDRFEANVAAAGFRGELTTIVGPSQETLRQLQPDSYDIIYIDGSHQADDVLVDVVLSWPLLRQRGILIFDDYQWKPELPPELRPRPAIDAFVTVFRREIEVVDRGYQLMIRKLDNPCEFHGSRCTIFGRYVYLWDERRLVDSRKPTEKIQLNDAERDLIESLSRDARQGDAGVYVPTRLIRSTEFIALRKKLRLRVDDQVIVRDTATTR
jgi:hypothetical protein